MGSCTYANARSQEKTHNFWPELISLLSLLKLHNKSSCDHFKKYFFLLLSFANNLLATF